MANKRSSSRPCSTATSLAHLRKITEKRDLEAAVKRTQHELVEARKRHKEAVGKLMAYHRKHQKSKKKGGKTRRA